MKVKAIQRKEQSLPRKPCRGEERKERNSSRREEVMVLTTNLHTAEGRIRGLLVTLGEGGGSRSSAHPEAFSTASTSASTPTPRLEKVASPLPLSHPLLLLRLLEYKDMILMKYAVTVMNAENQVTSSVFFFVKLLLSRSKIPTVPPLTSERKLTITDKPTQLCTMLCSLEKDHYNEISSHLLDLQILPIQTAVVGHVKQRLSEGSSKSEVVGNST
ncbi:hypothetical protein ALC60_08273 [Trachymyrmex zeteki]|uniref:Uncharacterized protein n=1 Tax=Mycetomoellerius zeteki TaxID=64791 RepID=A0A151WXK4_9HYME|nr:hypothetical protein ALC60_08273 [Trachymyrmex zeteki]